MPKLNKPREGSLQFAPRKRAAKFLPRVNWSVVSSASKEPSLLGFIAYKVGMITAAVKDSTDKSMTSGKRIYVPATVLEAPSMKICSIRFYNKGLVVKDIIVSNDKELKKIMKVPKSLPKLSPPEKFDDIHVIVFSQAKQTSLKKTPDIAEVAVHASTPQEKLSYASSLIGKEISVKDFSQFKLLDVRGLTTGRGFSGPVKRFGISFRQHKSEKGRRRPGSLGPWHPARVTFRTPMAGQLGMFSRIHYNYKVLGSGLIAEKDINKNQGFTHYGKVSSGYIILHGSVQGPEKRQLLLTPSFRPTKSQAKKKFELQEVLA